MIRDQGSELKAAMRDLTLALRAERAAGAGGDPAAMREVMRCLLRTLWVIEGRAVPLGAEEQLIDPLFTLKGRDVLMQAAEELHGCWTAWRWPSSLGGPTHEESPDLGAVDAGFSTAGLVRLLASGDPEAWMAKAANEAAASLPHGGSRTALEISVFLFHPSPLAFIDETTEMLGEALEASHVKVIHGLLKTVAELETDALDRFLADCIGEPTPEGLDGFDEIFPGALSRRDARPRSRITTNRQAPSPRGPESQVTEAGNAPRTAERDVFPDDMEGSDTAALDVSCTSVTPAELMQLQASQQAAVPTPLEDSDLNADAPDADRRHPDIDLF
ncbi:hypothetical protein [Streptomyces sp. NPDC047070]|uniref:hypothetical protein n=1 Tax=Streptomyces sp. NPDC047070 TaxID=3154923 RepID=UPI003452DCCC